MPEQWDDKRRTPVSIPLSTLHEITRIVKNELPNPYIKNDGVQRTFGAGSNVTPIIAESAKKTINMNRCSR